MLEILFLKRSVGEKRQGQMRENMKGECMELTFFSMVLPPQRWRRRGPGTMGYAVLCDLHYADILALGSYRVRPLRGTTAALATLLPVHLVLAA